MFSINAIKPNSATGSIWLTGKTVHKVLNITGYSKRCERQPLEEVSVVLACPHLCVSSQLRGHYVTTWTNISLSESRWAASQPSSTTSLCVTSSEKQIKWQMTAGPESLHRSDALYRWLKVSVISVVLLFDYYGSVAKCATNTAQPNVLSGIQYHTHTLTGKWTTGITHSQKMSSQADLVINLTFPINTINKKKGGKHWTLVVRQEHKRKWICSHVSKVNASLCFFLLILDAPWYDRFIHIIHVLGGFHLWEVE